VSRRIPFLILGAGPTGLSAAARLAECGAGEHLLVEKSDRVGGLAASFRDARGFTWDIGGHVLFSHYPVFDALVNSLFAPGAMLEHTRSAWARIGAHWVPYPVQRNLRHLPRGTAWACVDGLQRERENRSAPPDRFDAWAVRAFGRELADLFMLPYNRKVWAWPLERMGVDWIADRVAGVDLEKIREDLALERDDTGWGPNRTFRFPRSGGTGAIWERLAARAGRDRIRLNALPEKLDTDRRVLRLAGGGEVPYDHVLSTLPLPSLCALLLPSPPDSVRRLAAGLEYNTVHVVGIGLRGRPPEFLRGRSWMYFPGDECPFYRVTVFSNYSPENVPEGPYWSLLTETSASIHRPVDAEALPRAVMRGCMATGLLGEADEAVSTWTWTAGHAYPIPAADRDRRLEEIFAHLERRGVQSRGRFGAWRYEVGNQDHSAMQGREWADRMVNGGQERVYRGAAGA